MSKKRVVKKKRREVVMYNFIHRIAGPIMYLLMRFTCEQVRLVRAPTLILCNHVTDLDPVLIARAFPQYVRFVASEHIFRWGFFSKLLNFVFAPIMRMKGGTDARTAIETLRTLKSGKNVCIFAEGARSFNGVTAEIPPSTGKLLLQSGANLITYRLVGGFLTQPGWGKSHRRGRMHGEVAGRYTADELKRMGEEEVNRIIKRDLCEDAYARQHKEMIAYGERNLRRAENMELALYMCPKCGETGTLHSKGSAFTCAACGLDATYTKYGFLEGVDLPFNTIHQWDRWQQRQLSKMATVSGNAPFFTDERQTLLKIVPKKKSLVVEKGELTLYKDRLVCGNCTFLLDAISDLTNCSKMTLTFSTKKGGHYEIKSPYPRSATKYQDMFRILRENAGERGQEWDRKEG